MAESGRQGAVAVLGEPYFQCHIKRQGVLVLCKALGDADRGMDRLVCAGIGGLPLKSDFVELQQRSPA